MSLVLFDLDDTLINGDSASLWGQHMLALGWVDREGFVPQEQALMVQYQLGTLSMEEYMSFTLQPLIGRSPGEVAQQVEVFIDRVIVPAMREAACRQIEAHRQKGDRMIVISATGEHLVAPIAHRFGIDETVSIQLDVCDDFYTGNTRGVLTYREGKVTRLLNLLHAEPGLLDDAAFYSDSINDLPLLKRVGYPQVVNPDEALLGQAQLAGWPVLRW
ncbi:HAD family hydrolase [Acerihabitans sp. TG2]|uniref:HAD family hydrolase n=1 Tax=Acerihabitans sp. TG2 TaxID=3096008 RepID=UPI002B238506|nr:HAD family hydrolase [Acerihabitans sp. TG2]MEA9393018.1 HAD family hydrolase [Acerihabitans sp. TG2]